MTLVGEGGQETTFYLGSSAGIRSVHLRKGGEEVVYLADGLTAWDAGTNASDWVDTEYFKVDKDKLVSLRLKNATGEIALEKDAQGGWTMAGIKPAAAAPPAKRTTYSLRIGAKQDDSYFVKSESSPYVVRVAPWAVDQLLTKKPADLLKKEDQGQGAAGAPLPADLPLMMGDDEG